MYTIVKCGSAFFEDISKGNANFSELSHTLNRLLAPPFILKAAIYGLSKPETIPPFSSRTAVRLRWRLFYANTAISFYAQASRSIRAILRQLRMHAAHVPLFATQFLK